MRKAVKTPVIEKPSNSRLSSDILLLMFTLLAVFFLVSLLSYSANDPSFTTIIISKYDEAEQVANLFGKTGAYLADILGTVFGWPSLFIPFVFAYVAVLLYRYRKGLTFFFSPIIGFLYGLCTIICLSVLSGLTGGHDVYFSKMPAGGAFGSMASAFIVSIMGRVGGVLVFLFLLMAFCMLLFSISFSDMGRMFRIIFSFLMRLRPKRSDKPLTINKVIEPDIKSEPLLGPEELSAINNIKFNEPLHEEMKEAEPEPDNEPVFVYKKEPEKDIDIETDEDNEPEFIAPVKLEKVKFASYSIPLSILDDPDKSVQQDSESELKAKGDLLVQKLKDFGVMGNVRAIQPGPVVTMFEYEPAAGMRISKIAMLENDLALNMCALSIRIIAPIPGKNAVGIEVPNQNRASVWIKEILQTPEFTKSSSPLTVAFGKDVSGRAYMSDIRKMPHLLVAGTTGSGKSVGINTMICSILYKSSPDEVKFIMIDPKMVELSIYEGIPHLLAPVVTDPRLASSVLKNVVTEMTRRYSLLAENKVRNIEGYNEIAKRDGSEKMYYLVVIVDEFADLMMVSGKDIEISITRIAQMARAVGIHLIIATQRPTANVITGLIKSNMPARLAFKVSQKNDSRVILDQNGADTLLGRGDSLFMPPGSSDLVRVHGAFVSDEEVRNIVEHLKIYGEPEYNMDMVKEVRDGSGSSSDDDDEDMDEKYEEALNIVYDKGNASISMIQRQLKIGYNRAARIVEMMEKQGIVAPSDGTAKPREVLKR